MYDDPQSDLVVKYYDLAFGKGSLHEMNWYLDRVVASGGPVLDLACGTGRLSLMLAGKGFSVVGIDQSDGMLSTFRESLLDESDAVKDVIRIEQQAMQDFELSEQFQTVICCDAFFHNLSVEDEIACLNQVHKHLLPGGKLLFNIPNPNCAFIDHAEVSQGKEFRERARFDLGEEGEIVVEHAQAGNRLEQLITTTNRLLRYDGRGELIESGESTWTSRYLYRYEAEHLLHRCGFEVEAVVGNYKGDPVGAGGQLIFEARKTE